MAPLVSRSRVHRRFSRSSRRRTSSHTQWNVTSYLLTLTPPTVSFATSDVIPNELVKTFTGVTLVGGYAEISVAALSAAPAPLAIGFVTMGLRVLPRRTIAEFLEDDTDATPGIPLPFDDGEGSWPWWREVFVTSGGPDGTSTPLTDYGPANFYRSLDPIRSKRRMTEDDALCLVVQAHGTPLVPAQGQICVSLTFRLLLRE